MPEDKGVGDEIEVFVYTDSEDRLIATTEVPYATVGEFAYLQVSDVNSAGAFLDWGISGKDLLVPYSQQKSRMKQGWNLPCIRLSRRCEQEGCGRGKDRALCGQHYP